jgi:hypothetical protein
MKATTPNEILTRNTRRKESSYVAVKASVAAAMILVDTPGTFSISVTLPLANASRNGSTELVWRPASTMAGTTSDLVSEEILLSRIAT